MNHIIKLFLIAVAVVTAIPSYAVSQQEMEQARAMAAKHYLRYANNGSDYLDKLNPSTVAELSKSLKAKEQENIKAFNAVAVPKDYASWDKAKLVDYWSNTFFKSSGLNEDGKRCLSFLAKDLNKITVGQGAAQDKDAINSAPSDKPDKSDKSDKSDDKSDANKEATMSQADGASPQPQSEADLVSAEAAAAEVAAAEPEATEEERPQKQSGTIWYIIILVILIGVVIWLVMYAQKSMKESGQIVADHKEAEREVREAKKSAKEEINKMRDQYAASIAAKNEEIKQLRERCASLEEQLEASKTALSKAAQSKDAVHNASQCRPQDKHSERPEQPTTENRQQKTENAKPKTTLPPVVFLGYVNQRGLFVKASRSLNAESSVYRMDIPDGTHGTYRVVNDPSVLDRLLGDPGLWLAGGCDIDNPEDADIATEIVTLSEGQALFADNTCRVIKKARIKFI